MTQPPDERGDPVAAFGGLCTRPGRRQRRPGPGAGPGREARALHAAFDAHVIEVVDRVEAPGKLALAFWPRARHVGRWKTPLGELVPTGRIVTGLGIDVLTVTGQHISGIWVLADELQTPRTGRRSFSAAAGSAGRETDDVPPATGKGPGPPVPLGGSARLTRPSAWSQRLRPRRTAARDLTARSRRETLLGPRR